MLFFFSPWAKRRPEMPAPMIRTCIASDGSDVLDIVIVWQIAGKHRVLTDWNLECSWICETVPSSWVSEDIVENNATAQKLLLSTKQIWSELKQLYLRGFVIAITVVSIIKASGRCRCEQPIHNEWAR